MKSLAGYLSNVTYFLILCCIISVSFAYSLRTYHPFDPIKEAFFGFFVLLAFYLLMVRTILTGTFAGKRDLLYLFVFLYLCYNALSFMVSPYAGEGYFINLVLLILFFFTVAESINSEKRYTYLIYTIAVVGLISAIYGISQVLGYDEALFLGAFGPKGLGPRMFSFFGNPNLFAAFIVITLPMLLSGFFTSRRYAKCFFAACIIFAVGSLLMTGSRAGVLGSVISVALFFVLTHRKAQKKTYLWAVSGTAVLVLAGFILSATITESGIARLSSRQGWWQASLKIARDYPLFGTGVGSFEVHYPSYRKRSTEIAAGEKNHETRVDHPHNEFLEILSDLGICGLLLFLGILFAYFYKYYSQWDPKRKYFIAGNSCALFGILIHNLYSVNLRFVFVAMFFWLTLGLQSALLSRPKTEEAVTLNLGRIVASLVPLPLIIFVFFGYSLRRFEVESHLGPAMQAYNKHDYQEAEFHFKNALENDLRDKWSLYYLGVTQYRLEKFPESKQTLRTLIQLDPNYLQVHYWFANIFFRTQDFKTAKEEYLESLRVNDAYGPSYFALGHIALEENNIPQALDHFEQAYTLVGDHTTQAIRPRALRELIKLHRQLGNQQEAEGYLEKLRELEGA